MSTVTDRFDAPFGAATEEVADQVRRGMDLFFGFDFEGIEVLEAATQDDPACVLGHVLLSVFLRLEGDPSGAGRHVRAAITAAPDATDRERSLVGLFFGASMVYRPHLGWHAALLAWADDRVDEAVDRMRIAYQPFGFDRAMRIIDEARSGGASCSTAWTLLTGRPSTPGANGRCPTPASRRVPGTPGCGPLARATGTPSNSFSTTSCSSAAATPNARYSRTRSSRPPCAPAARTRRPRCSSGGWHAGTGVAMHGCSHPPGSGHRQRPMGHPGWATRRALGLRGIDRIVGMVTEPSDVGVERRSLR